MECKITIDNNILLDYFLERKDFIESASKIMDLVESKEICGLISSNSITDVYYFLKKYFDHDKAIEYIEIIDNYIKISKVDRDDIINSTKLDFNDLEDALVSYCSEREKSDYIVTRNEKDFKNSKIPAISPEKFLESIEKNLQINN